MPKDAIDEVSCISPLIIPIIKEQYDLAAKCIIGPSEQLKYPNSSFAAGVYAALGWVLGIGDAPIGLR